jgi:RNA polymerase sigma-70 factor (ECF subfamily)
MPIFNFSPAAWPVSCIKILRLMLDDAYERVGGSEDERDTKIKARLARFPAQYVNLRAGDDIDYSAEVTRFARTMVFPQRTRSMGAAISFAPLDRHTLGSQYERHMAEVETRNHQPEEAASEGRATVADETAFADLTRRYRRELHVHCYRMLASFEDAEDLVQETFLRAWQKRATYQGRAPFRAWLYRIATNACLDFLARHERRVVELTALGAPSGKDVTLSHFEWLQPYPDRLLGDVLAPSEADARLIRRETIELAFLVALQCLPPKQRAVLILRDVLDWTAEETATLLESSVASVNAALQRARATLRRHQPSRDESSRPRGVTEQEMLLLRRYADATERLDTEALTRLLRDDARFSMPPSPAAYVGNSAIVQACVEGGFGRPPYSDFRYFLTSANRMPAAAFYTRKPGDVEYRPFMIDVLQVVDDGVAQVTAFELPGLLAAFDLPATLSMEAQ